MRRGWEGRRNRRPGEGAGEGALELCPNLEERVGRGRGRPFTWRGIQERMDELQEVEESTNWSFDEERNSVVRRMENRVV
ncbi:hypothetical protein AKJ37_04890 [candidate division MSBL1 archaeon SCGC-AAA259I09]|uniref:Uncharacterized protein n=3 Tax=candidate division MSBL1 TaxID=215777 RepID=A0A133UR10_9EURY|nr:hypothetical protein AKJ61_02420 [candidate division MSBL1 archaeon SCGC-AAA259B11]KXA96579.1 hypothetical protein AKJ37_04890 [candidate division MSBL1 archaeon SCGC-AAA259I09]KXA99655.1 hypothetical protein AKJ40_02700 [candidate division MSBL1 archaeon SCGC-AAA259M10]